MPQRAAIITGASRGIGLALADVLASEGYDLTITARDAEKLQKTAALLTDRGANVQHLAADAGDEGAIQEVVRRHTDRFGRLDVLVNNAGIGVKADVSEQDTRMLDLQLRVNFRSIVLFYRECAGMLRSAGEEHGRALVVNLASLAAKDPQPWLSVYSATKAAAVAYTEAMNKELNSFGVKSVALCPGYVDTDMTDFVKDSVPADKMIRTSDIAEALRFLLRVSPACVIPEIVFHRPGEV
jgi:short-subunit dehydrogenase